MIYESDDSSTALLNLVNLERVQGVTQKLRHSLNNTQTVNVTDTVIIIVSL